MYFKGSDLHECQKRSTNSPRSSERSFVVSLVVALVVTSPLLLDGFYISSIADSLFLPVTPDLCCYNCILAFIRPGFFWHDSIVEVPAVLLSSYTCYDCIVESTQPGFG